MAYQFTPNLHTGNALIDEQHQKLFAAINALLLACASGQGRAELSKTTKFLYDYTSSHFRDEQQLQLTHQYPDYANHQRYHEEFKKVVLNLMRQLEEQGATIALVAQVNSTVGAWLINHIQKEDTRVAAHIQSRRN